MSQVATIARVRALDLFAGTGWGVACQRLGIAERGVEIMEEAVQTRTANGMETIYRDVWDGLQMTEEQHRKAYGAYGLLIASPPCQTFSLAGNGAGRAALNDVIEAIETHAYKDADALLAFGQKHDPRTALVLTPLAYVWRDRPRLVAMEQVPTVLPVWEACAEVMREWGYEVKVEVLNAEQYGVPQTRRRAILVARRGGPVHLPVPTHSRYHSRTPDRLDPDVKRWVSMADALGWGMTDAPMPTITAGTHGPTDRWASGGNSVRKMIDAKIGGPDWIPPAEPLVGDGNVRTQYNVRIGVEEASLLQTYPSTLLSTYSTGGDYQNRGERTLDQPAPTVTSKAGRNKWDGMEGMTPEQAAALQTFPPTLRPEVAAWKWVDAPATTIQGDPRITAREHHYHGEQSKTSLKLIQEEASILQTYARPFVWCGNKSKKFLQIGNAVPPLLAEAVLAAAIGIRPGR